MEVKKALRQWMDRYAAQLEEDYLFKLYKNGNGNHVIQVDERLDNDSFYFLVNYMQYPLGIDYQVRVEGYTRGTERNVLKGKELFVFISETDTEYDNVYVVTMANESYKVEFSGKITESSETRTYQKPASISVEAPVILKVDKENSEDRFFLADERRTENRLKWIFILIITLHVFNFLLVKPFSVDKTISFENLPFFISFGISLWLFWDYKVLQKNTRYLKCIGLISGILVYLFLLVEMEVLEMSKEKTAVALFPLVLLLFQWPLRYIFKQLANREPIVENHPRSFTNGFYTIVLLVIPVAITLILTGIV